MVEYRDNIEQKVNKNGFTGFQIFVQTKEVRTKIKYSCCLWFAFLMSGWMLKQLGPALLDIQQITGVSFMVASTYATVLQLGYVCGCFLSGYLQGRVHSSILLCITFVGYAISAVWLPWSTKPEVTYAVYCIIGLCLGNIDSIVVAELSALWGSSVSMPMQMAFSCYSIGGGIAVLITAPFLRKTIEGHLPDNTRFTTTTTTTSTTINNTIENEHSKVYIPFSLTATLAVVAAGIFFVLYFMKKKGNVAEYVDIKERSLGKLRNVTQKAIGLVIISVIMALSCSISFDVSYFLTSILVKLSISSRSDSASITSLFTVFQVIGRVSGIATVQVVDHFSLLLGHSAISIIGLIGIWNSVIYNSPIITLCFSVALAGFGMSVISASLKAWVEESFFPVTGLLSSYFATIKITGDIISCLGIGYFVDNYSPLMFLYITFGQAVLLFLFVFIANGFRITTSSY